MFPENNTGDLKLIENGEYNLASENAMKRSKLIAT